MYSQNPLRREYMKKERWVKMLRKIILTVVGILCAGSMTVHAEEISTSVSFDVKNSITGDTPETPETFTYILASEDGTDETQLTINGAGEGSFEETYTTPGMYTYKVYEVKGSDSHYTYDETIYEISVYVYADGTELSTMVKVYKTDSDVKTDSILFINTYENPDDTSTSTDTNSDTGTSSETTTPFWALPQTGDKANIWWSVFMIFISIAGIVLLLVLRKKNS